MVESIRKSESEDRLIESCEALMNPEGFRIVDMDVRIGHRSMVRIFIDRLRSSAESEGRNVSLEDCTRVSRLIGPVLEQKTVLPGAFDLEVSSPGLDRRLRQRQDFESVLGQEVRLKLVEKLEGIGANCSGVLKAIDAQGVLVEVSGRDCVIAWNSIKQANRVWREE